MKRRRTEWLPIALKSENHWRDRGMFLARNNKQRENNVVHLKRFPRIRDKQVLCAVEIMFKRWAFHNQLALLGDLLEGMTGYKLKEGKRNG